MIKIPTSLSAQEGELLLKLSKGVNVLEVGSLLGYSSILMSQNAHQVTSIDPHINYPFENPAPTWKQFLNNIDRYNVNNITPIRDKFQNVNLKERFGLLFIDINGQFKTTYEYINKYNTDIIAIHDFNRQNCEGIARAVKESNKEIITATDTLIVLK